MNTNEFSAEGVESQADNDAQVNHALSLASTGRYPEAIAALSAANRKAPNGRWELLLTRWRYLNYQESPPTGNSGTTLQAVQASPFQYTKGVPVIPADKLDARHLAHGIQQHGALWVKGLLECQAAADLVVGIQSSLDAQAHWLQHGATDPVSPWYSRLEMRPDEQLAEARPWVEGAGGVWMADSPRMMFKFLELLQSSRVLEAISGYLDERPMLSVGKTTLRRVPSTISMADWHQDGAFMGTNIRSVNLWLSLSDCGLDASGLDFLPQRLDRILDTGTHGANFPWSVGQGIVDQLAQESPIDSPAFAAGDALLFDHFFLHRTGIPKAIAKDRYAIESWFFAPSAYPAQQVPLYV